MTTNEGSVPAARNKSRLASAAWCTLMPLCVVAAYLGLGLAVVSVVKEPVLGTAILDGAVVLLVGGLRVLRPQLFTHAPRSRQMTETPRFTRTVTIGMVLAFLAGQSLALWLYALGGSAEFDESTRARHDAGPVVVLVLALVAAPLAEEVIFRGLLYPLLRRRAGIVASALITAAVFAAMHGNMVQFASSLPLAVLLALVYERVRAVWPCVLIHLGFNVAAVLVPASALSGLANPVSALLLATAFLGCARAAYRMAAQAAAIPSEGSKDEAREPRAAQWAGSSDEGCR
jgi:membrane protease YdiL (CAAX protease family)